jgi:hypothetical protein
VRRILEPQAPRSHSSYLVLAAGPVPQIQVAGVRVYQPHLVGQLVEVAHCLRFAARLARQLAAQVVDAVEEPAEEDAKVGHFQRPFALTLFQARGGDKADGKLTACCRLFTQAHGRAQRRFLADVSDWSNRSKNSPTGMIGMLANWPKLRG